MTKNDKEFSGVAVITGAASGIGAGIARAAARRKMALVLADIDSAALEKLAEALDVCAVCEEVDVRKLENLESLAALAFKRFGRVDLLFNNAGIMVSGRSWEIPAEEWQRAFDINVMGVVNGVRAFLPRMLESGKPGRIVNTASVGGFFAGPLMAPYAASKAAVVALTEALEQELSRPDCKISVSLLAPGAVKTDILRADAPTASAKLISKMREMTDERGADPDAYAELILDAIDAGEFWIVPQPESLDDRVRDRSEMILERTAPSQNAKRKR